MAADYHFNVTKSQSQAASHIFFPFGAQDWSASNSQTAHALEFYTNDTKSTSYTDSTCSFTTIGNKLDSSNNPLVLGIWYISNDYGHAVACYGYTQDDNQLYWIDPKLGSYNCWSYSDYFDGIGARTDGMAFFQDGQW